MSLRPQRNKISRQGLWKGQPIEGTSSHTMANRDPFKFVHPWWAPSSEYPNIMTSRGADEGARDKFSTLFLVQSEWVSVGGRKIRIYANLKDTFSVVWLLNRNTPGGVLSCAQRTQSDTTRSPPKHRHTLIHMFIQSISTPVESVSHFHTTRHAQLQS